jgi:hypothetical protein
VANDVERLGAGRRLLRNVPHLGKMLGDLRILDAGDELQLDCERAALRSCST